MDTFFERACSGDARFETVSATTGRLADRVEAISDQLARSPRSVAFLHFPFADIESGVSVEWLLRAYMRILDACGASESICVIGGQQPVNSFTDEMSDRQLELERRASAVFSANYVPLYRHFQSESSIRRLMVTLDSGDGRFIGDHGHELLYKLYRRRLLELAGPNKLPSPRAMHSR
jgi:hypothetical protein